MNASRGLILKGVSKAPNQRPGERRRALTSDK